MSSGGTACGVSCAAHKLLRLSRLLASQGPTVPAALRLRHRYVLTKSRTQPSGRPNIYVSLNSSRSGPAQGDCAAGNPAWRAHSCACPRWHACQIECAARAVSPAIKRRAQQVLVYEFPYFHADLSTKELLTLPGSEDNTHLQQATHFSMLQ